MTSDHLYNLLPSIYRLQDAAQGEALRALLGVMESELDALESDIGGLYDDWFIETAAEWVLPYIGDLLGVRGLHSESSSAFSLRAYVANTLAYRRRKGTASMLEQLAHDITGWNARVVEFFQLLGTTQYLNHLRPENLRTPDLRNASALELLDTPFDSAAHTADIRHISNAGLRPAPTGKYNIPNIGIYLWRLQAYAVEAGDARPQGGGGEFFTINPLGLDQPVFNLPQTEQSDDSISAISHLAEEINVPAALRRRPLFNELEGLRQSLAGGQDFSSQYFNPDHPVLQVYLDNSPTPLPSEQVVICDLSAWRNPPATIDYPKPDGTLLTLPIGVAVDPQLGRLAFPSGAAHDPVRVSYAYGFSGDVGGGPYNRTETVNGALKGSITWQTGVTQQIAAIPGEIYNTLADAVTDWNAQPAGTIGMIAIMDSCTYTENLTGGNAIHIPSGSQLLFLAADWPALEDPVNPGVFIRTIGEFAADELRPHIDGNISVRGTASTNSPNPGELVLDGLLVEGRLNVLAGNLGSLQANHCTLVPGLGGSPPALVVNSSGTPGSQNDRLSIQMMRSICNQVSLPISVPFFSARDSLLDQGAASTAIDAPGSDVSLRECTVFGTSQVRSLEASNCIFTGELNVERRQAGCVRYSFVPDGSSTPRRYRCQPDLGLTERAAVLGLESSSDLPPAERALLLQRIKPGFSSLHYGDPDYAQLSRESETGILTGAEDGSEMGVFSFLKQPQREANLRVSLNEYLRFGLEAGIFFVT